MVCQEVNLGGVIKGNKVAAMHMAQRGGGVIVNTASMAGFMANG
jgi:NAD(P)-dependent dehydrogenase (short-subunit alcohol dehydrogenase family)